MSHFFSFLAGIAFTLLFSYALYRVFIYDMGREDE